MTALLKKTALPLAVIFSISVLSSIAARKNEPDDVEELLEKVGGKHFVEDMKVYEVGSMELENEETEEETYYHIYWTYVNDRYRVLFFDNDPTYLGYYEINYEPYGYEEGAIMLGDSESPFYIRFGFEGPQEKISIDGVRSTFVKNEEAEKKRLAEEKAAEEAAAKAEEMGAMRPEYREWTLNIRGREFSFRAIFVKKAGSKVFLKEEKRGLTSDFDLSSLSREDLEYLQALGEI